MSDISNISAGWKDGGLSIFKDDGGTLLTINSTGAYYAGMFGGYLLQTVNVTAATALSTAGSLGLAITCTTDEIVFTLPGSSTTLVAGLSYTIINTASDGAAHIVVRTKTLTSDCIVGIGTVSTASTHAVTNASTTHIYGDRITINASDVGAGKAVWSLHNVVGTWALSATS